MSTNQNISIEFVAQTTAAVAVLKSPHLEKYRVDEAGHKVKIAVRFSEAPKDSWSQKRGYTFGRSRLCDYCLDAETISSLHFRILFNVESGCPILVNDSKCSTIVDSRSTGKTTVFRGGFHPILDGDTIQVAFCVFGLRIHHKKGLRQEREFTLPSLDALTLSDTESTVIESRYLCLLINNSSNKRLERAVDQQGTFYVVKTEKQYPLLRQEITALEAVALNAHCHIATIVKDRCLPLNELSLITVLPPFGTLEEQTSMPMTDMKSIIRQCLEAVDYLQSTSRTELRIKQASIGIFSRNPPSIKLGDFGIARPGNTLDSSSTAAANVWSLGFLLSRFCIWGTCVRKFQQKPKEPVSRPGWEALTMLAYDMLLPDHAARPSASVCLNKISAMDDNSVLPSTQYSDNLAFLRRSIQNLNWIALLNLIVRTADPESPFGIMVHGLPRKIPLVADELERTGHTAIIMTGVADLRDLYTQLMTVHLGHASE
ncbi:hypothetical protein MMC07_001433 [Pseudocyphellaria aurata]|nr:hypothetical protein [Pseudocyphellaria aurata]